jgi:hypothetical protein
MIWASRAPIGAIIIATAKIMIFFIFLPLLQILSGKVNKTKNSAGLRGMTRFSSKNM